MDFYIKHKNVSEIKKKNKNLIISKQKATECKYINKYLFET